MRHMAKMGWALCKKGYLSVALLGEDGALPEIREPRPPVSCHEHLCRVDVVMDEPRALERVASVQQARADEHAEGDELEGVGLLELDELVQLRRARVLDQLLERTARSLKKKNSIADIWEKWGRHIWGKGVLGILPASRGIRTGRPGRRNRAGSRSSRGCLRGWPSRRSR